MSGSCQLKTCWKAAPDFRTVGKVLKQKYRKAVSVDLSNFGNGILIHKGQRRRHKAKPVQYRAFDALNDNDNSIDHIVWEKRNRKNKISHVLLFYEKSPNFCESNQSLDFVGTSGRICNRTGTMGDCRTLCCGRGYKLVRQVVQEPCNCRFFWCCTIQCHTCTYEKWISHCN